MNDDPTSKNNDINPPSIDLTNRSDNLFLDINNSKNNSVTIKHSGDSKNSYSQINEKSVISNASYISSNDLGINQSQIVKNVELKNINHLDNYHKNDTPKHLNIDKSLPENNFTNYGNFEYTQVNNNLDNSKLTNIPLSNCNTPPLGFLDDKQLNNNMNNNKNNNKNNNRNNNNKTNFNLTQTIISNKLTQNHQGNGLGTGVTGNPRKENKENQIKSESDARIGLTPKEKENDIFAEKKNYKISCCYYIFNLILLILLIPTTSLVYYARTLVNYSEINYFAEISNNWFKSPISEISDDCNLKESLINDRWPGTNYGCKCGNELSVGRCRRRSFCDNIDYISPMSYGFWKKKEICVKRYPLLTYLDLNITKSGEDCENMNMQNCGVIDTEKNILCFEKGRKCPYNKLIKNNINKHLWNEDIQISFDNSNFFFSRNGSDSIIPVQFKIGFGKPCLNPSYENLNFQIYKLNYFYLKQKCYMYSIQTDGDTLEYDNSYIYLDNYYGQNFYAENGIIQKLSTLPYFNEKEYQRDVYLFYKNYFGLKYDCFISISKERYTDQILFDLRKMSDLEDLSVTLIISIIFQLILIIIFIFKVCCFRAIIYKRRGERPIRIGIEHICCYSIFLSISFICYLGFISVNIQSSSNLTFSEKFHEIFSSNQCVNDYTIDLFKKFIPSLDVAKTNLNKSIYFCIFIFAMEIFFYLYSCCTVRNPEFYQEKLEN